MQLWRVYLLWWQQAFEASNERSVLADDDRAHDSETVICFHNRMIKLLSQFGFSVDSPTFDIPEAVSLLLSKSKEASKVTQPLPIVSLNCGGTWNTLDTSQPPPPVLPSAAPSTLSFPAPPPKSAGPGIERQASTAPAQHTTFLLDSRNNINLLAPSPLVTMVMALDRHPPMSPLHLLLMALETSSLVIRINQLRHGRGPRRI